MVQISKRQTHSLSKKILFSSIEKQTALTSYQCMSAYLELSMPEAYSLAEEEFVNIYALFNQIVRSIPDGYVIHKQDYYNHAHYKKKLDDSNFLAASFELKFNERLYMEHKSYLMITKVSKEQVNNNVMTNFIMGTVVKKDILDSFNDFNHTVKKVSHILQEGKIPCRKLKDREILNLINIYFNLGDSRILKDIQIEKDHLTIGGEEVVMHDSVAYEVALPSELNTPLNISPYFDKAFTFDMGIGFSQPHIVNTIIRKPDKNSMIKTLSAQRERTASLSFKSRENQMLVEEFDEYLSSLTESENIPILFSQNLIAWGDKKKVKKTENEISNVLNKMKIYTQRNFNCGAEYWYNCPANAGNLTDSAYQVQLSNIATYFLPIESNPKNTGAKGLKFVERRYGIPFLLDLWNEPYDSGLIGNRNMFVLGPSGSGKSFLVNHMIRQFIEQGYHITMIDVGGSYERSCNFLGGEYFEYRQDNKMAFNPFFIPVEKGQYIFRSDDELESLNTLIITLWKGQGGKTSQEEKTTISTSLAAYFKHIKDHQLKSDFNTYYEFIRDHVNVVFDKKELQWFNLDSFLHVLKPYYKGGTCDYLLNSEKEFSIADLQYCVFELDEVKNNPIIFSVIILIIMDAFLANNFGSKKNFKRGDYKTSKEENLARSKTKVVSHTNAENEQAAASPLPYLSKSINAFIDQKVKIRSGDKIQIRVLEDSYWKKIWIPTNTFLYGWVSISSNRAKIRISFIKLRNGKGASDIIRTNMLAYDTDHLEGIYIDGTFNQDTKDALKEGLRTDYFVYTVSRLHQIPDTKEENRKDVPAPTYTDNSTTTTAISYQENLNVLEKMETNPRYRSKTSINIASPNRKRSVSDQTARSIIELEGKIYRQEETAYDEYAPAITSAGYKVLERLRLYTHIKNRHRKVTLRVTDIYHSLDHAFIKYEVKNMSSIPYDIKYISSWG